MMTDALATQPAEDAAWISVDLPVPSSEAYRYIQDIERFFRLNPHLEIKGWQEEVPGELYTGKQMKVCLLNEMNGLQQDLTLQVNDVQTEKSLSLTYSSGLKQSTHISLHGLSPATTRLVIKDFYPAELSKAEREARLHEVDRSLIPWGAAIHRYFIRNTRWGWLPFYNWWQNSFWLGMTPRHRRITRMIIWTTVLEFVVFLFVFVIYWLELGRVNV